MKLEIALNMSAWEFYTISIIRIVQGFPAFDVEPSTFPITPHASIGTVILDWLKLLCTQSTIASLDIFIHMNDFNWITKSKRTIVSCDEHIISCSFKSIFDDLSNESVPLDETTMKAMV
jgi:hypothetical protein